MKKALIVIDLQNDYFSGGNMELYGIDEALKKANTLIEFARKQNYEIYFVQHFSITEGATFFIPNTKGVELNSKLDIKNEMVVAKNYPNSFRETILKEELDNLNINNLIICGAMTHMCVDSTVRAAFDLGYHITLAHDACATKDLNFNEATIGAKNVHGSFVSALDGTFCDAKSVKDIVDT